MRKQLLTALIFYAQEMGILLLILLSIGTTLGTNAAFYLGHLLWFAVIYLLAVLPLFLMPSRQGTWLLFLSFIVLLFAYLIWDYSLFHVLLIAIVPIWRISRIISVQPEQAELITRLVTFCAVGLVGYLIMRFGTDHTIGVAQFPYFVLVQFLILFLGIYLFDFFRAQETMGLSLEKWLRGQSLITYLGFAIGLLALGVAFLIPYLRALLAKIPELMIWFFNLPFVLAFFEHLFGWLASIPIRSPEGTIEEPMTELESHVEQAESTIPEWLVTGSAFVFQALFIAVIAYVLYVLFRNFYLSRIRSVQGVAGERYQTSARQVQPFRRKRKVSWSRDEVRRQYQALLMYAFKKGEHIPAGATAREWVRPYLKKEGYEQVWQRINDLYEKRRYNEEALTEEELETFRQEVKLAKKELKRYYKETHTKNRRQQDEA